jgi:hypothetical protein
MKSTFDIKTQTDTKGEVRKIIARLVFSGGSELCPPEAVATCFLSVVP